MARHDGRSPDALRAINITTGFLDHHPGSVLVSFGRTRVLCAATIEERVPPFRVHSGGGWLTATYAMLPASTHSRRQREITKPDGRSQEIQRLIGRALRNIVNIDVLGQRTVNVDCDVLQADGGTRTASITGAYVALRIAMAHVVANKSLNLPTRDISKMLTGQLAAVSVGMVGGEAVLDLDYIEDSKADTDLNLVARNDGSIVEIQGTAEGAPMLRTDLDAMITLGLKGIETLTAMQDEAIAKALENVPAPASSNSGKK